MKPLIEYINEALKSHTYEVWGHYQYQVALHELPIFKEIKKKFEDINFFCDIDDETSINFQYTKECKIQGVNFEFGPMNGVHHENTAGFLCNTKHEYNKNMKPKDLQYRGWNLGIGRSKPSVEAVGVMQEVICMVFNSMPEPKFE